MTDKNSIDWNKITKARLLIEEGIKEKNTNIKEGINQVTIKQTKLTITVIFEYYPSKKTVKE